MTEQILTEFKQQISELVLVPAAGGRFEVYLDGTQVFNKKEAGRFPQYEEIQTAIRQRLR